MLGRRSHWFVNVLNLDYIVFLKVDGTYNESFEKLISLTLKNEA